MIAGRYSLEREIGRGGSATVHLARDEVLGRQVALKRIGVMPGADTPELARAEREARLAASLNHPHVVSIFDLVMEDDAHWLVMEYVDGRTLSDLVRTEGPLDSREAARVLSQAADALADAHAAGIVHRDVKPSNILMTDELEAKLGDFGIARADQDAALTRTGLVTGSPAYLAPEVASGATASSASDVWSLGATLFHALEGRPPYDTTDNLMGALFAIVNEDPPRLPAGHPLAGLLAVTMEKDPARRWPMHRVRDDLRRVASGMTSTAPTEATSVLTPTPNPTRGTPTLPATPVRGGGRFPTGWLVVAAAVLLVAVLTWWMWPGDDGRPEAQPPGDSQASASTTDNPQTEPAAETSERTRQEMAAFVTEYLETVTSDPRTAFEQLTPEFQEASNGFGGYNGWWRTVESASVSRIVPNVDNLTVSYTVDYVMKNGSRSTEQVILQLERQDDRYLIAGEA